MRSVELKRCLYLLALVGAQLAHAQDDESSNRTMTIELRKTITMEERVGGCNARLAIEYWQKGDVADVKMVLNNDECAASHGDFTIEVRVRDDDGELSSEKFAEVWAREDDRPLAISRLYRIGDDVDLIRVRSSGLSCTCDGEGDNSERDD